MTSPRDTSRLEVLETTVHKTHIWINEVAKELGWESEQQSFAALRAVLHAIRDRLTVDEAGHLSAQLPMLIRGMYFEGWKPAATPVRARTRDDFLQLVRSHFRGYPDVDVAHVTRAVFAVIDRFVTSGEVRDIRRMLPSDLKDLWPHAEHAVSRT